MLNNGLRHTQMQILVKQYRKTAFNALVSKLGLLRNNLLRVVCFVKA